jgi:hypothetical protein
MMIAVAVGYLLVSAIPQQVSMYTTPQRMLSSGYEEPKMESTPDSGSESLELPEMAPDNYDEIREVSFVEIAQLPELGKWWTINVLLALMAYWIARKRLV